MVGWSEVWTTTVKTTKVKVMVKVKVKVMQVDDASD
jgi:hypothetical protein